VKRKSYEAPHYAVFSSLLSFPPCSQNLSIYAIGTEKKGAKAETNKEEHNQL
jgi:hypothetical protein